MLIVTAFITLISVRRQLQGQVGAALITNIRIELSHRDWGFIMAGSIRLRLVSEKK